MGNTYKRGYEMKTKFGGYAMTDYIPVLCCSKSKSRKNFSYKKYPTVNFVASPNKAPDDGTLYCTPDDNIPGTDKTWRDLINEQNHKDLVPAFELYKKEVYPMLHEKYGEYFYIFSAGWGIVRSTYKLPFYDITYSKQNNPLVERTENMQWNDFNHLKDDANEGKFSSDAEIVLFADTDYFAPFYKLTSDIKNKKIIIHAEEVDEETGYDYKSYCGDDPKYWFYRAAKKFCSEGLTAPNFKK
jgi:hypothetical protein